MATESMYIGKKISRIRELKGMKQETLAAALGVSQQAISKLEQSEDLDEERLKAVADALGVTPEAIRKFNENAVFSNISNVFHDHAMLVNYQFNPIEKYLEMVERNRELYERLLQAEKEKSELLEKMINKK
jgi:transcriptional regulator with XRE-family HTH domain